jgi:dolichol-phosphate mannosyltransferase
MIETSFQGISRRPKSSRCLSIVVPTRNEEQNVEPLISRLDKVLTPVWEWELVVVDDSSDDTPQQVRRLEEAGLPVRLLHRPPEARPGGLGGAVIAGLAITRGEIVAVMDADLQHPPERLPLMAEILIEGDIDVAIASRFAPGGEAFGLDGPLRAHYSRWLRWLTRVAVPDVRAIRDPLSGYFAIRRSVIEQGPLSCDGFKILLEVLAFGSWREAIEVPFQFEPRLHGQSKASWREGVALLRQVGRIRRANRSHSAAHLRLTAHAVRARLSMRSTSPRRAA